MKLFLLRWLCIFFSNWDLLHTKLSSHYKAWNYKKKKHNKIKAQRTGLFTFAIDVKMNGSAFEEKSSFKMLEVTFSSKLDWGTYIISIAKTATKKIGALICSMKFLFLEAALYLF